MSKKTAVSYPLVIFVHLSEKQHQNDEEEKESDHSTHVS